MIDAGELMQDPQVRRWLTRSGYDSRSQEERRELLADLERFCDFTGKAPSDLIESCMRTTDEGLRKISIKGRRAMQDSIEGYVASRGLSGHDAVVVGNRIRGFLVHNGVFIQGRASIR